MLRGKYISSKDKNRPLPCDWKWCGRIKNLEKKNPGRYSETQRQVFSQNAGKMLVTWKPGWAWWQIPVRLGRQRWEEQEFKVNLSYTVSLKSAHGTGDLVLKKKVWKCVQKIPLRSGAYKGCGRESWKLQLKFRNDDVGMRPSCRTQLWPFRPAWWVGHGLVSTVLIFLPPLFPPPAFPPSLPPWN